MKYKSIKDHAYFDYEKGILQLSTRYKNIKDSQIKEFLITLNGTINYVILRNFENFPEIFRCSRHFHNFP